MEHSLYCRLEAEVKLTDQEFEFLVTCCKHHYSYDCTSLIEVGGFMYGWNGRREFEKTKGDGRSSYNLTFRQMDTLLKVLEVAPYFANAVENGDIWVGLNKFFHGILRQINEAGPIINEKIEKGEIK
jgi:hypothetical protein